MLIPIEKIEVHLDFHIFFILDFDLLIAYPFEKLFLEKPSHGSLNEKLGKTAFTTPISHPESPMAKHHLNHDRFEEVKLISPFVSPKLASHPYETEHPSPPSLEPKPCPFGHQNIVLDNGRDSTLILHDISPEKETPMPWTIPKHRLLRPKKRIPQMSMKPSLSKSLKIHAHFWSLKSSFRLKPRAPTRIPTISQSSFINFLEGWLWMLLFIINIAKLLDALWH